MRSVLMGQSAPEALGGFRQVKGLGFRVQGLEFGGLG